MGSCGSGGCGGCGEKHGAADGVVPEGDEAARGFLGQSIAHKEDEYRPLYPRRAAPFKVHWNWEIMLPCNFRCSYCVVHNESAQFLQLPVADWRRIWTRMFKLYGCSQVRFAGGEPTIYPDFINLVGMILEMHTVDITTNLSFDVEEWIKKVPCDGIAISGSLHLEHFKPEDFLRKLLILRERGNQLISASLVAYPPDIPRVEAIRDLFEKAGVLFKIIPFNGVYQGKRYPGGYTDEERRILGMQVEKSQDELGKTLNKQWQDYANSKPDDKNFMGIPCHMGEMYAKIYSDGTVRRCCHTGVEILGRITDPNLKLFDEPKPCTVLSCSCWKPMVAGRYEAKVDMLWQSANHPKFPVKAPNA
ncbi:MAG: radical SAM protein [Elusimicrobia bacterium]|nr:radical SAM protein [Elusimicrobiota bacterium]